MIKHRNSLPFGIRARIGRLLLAAFSLALLVSPASSSAAVKGVQTDLTWGSNNPSRQLTVDGVKDLGAGWMRLTMAWSDIETNSDNSYTGLKHYDNAMSYAAQTGTKLVVTVYKSPTWASGQANTESPPLDPEDYADFLRFAATRWGDKVDAWEIWNEQNSKAFWSTGPSPTRYAQLLKAAYPAVKSVDPSALVLYGGVSHNDYRFIEQSYAAEPNLGDYYDVMATHPYPTPATTTPEYTWRDSDGRLAVRSFSSYREIREVMLANGDDKPMWFTEFGWSTNTLAGLGVSEATQAAYYTRAMQCLEQDPYVEVAIWYIFRNHHWAGDANTWLDQLGLVRTDFTKKLAYNAFKSYTPGNAGCTYFETAPTPELEPTPEPTPEPEPTAEPATEDPEPTDEPDAGEEEEGVQSSSVRREVEIRLVRLRRLAQASGTGTRTRTRRVRMRVEGRVSRADRGRVDLRLTCRARGDGDWRRSMTRRLDVSRTGRYATRIRPRHRAVCRTRASYRAFGERLGRSRILRFKT